MMMIRSFRPIPTVLALSLLALTACDKKQPGPVETPEPSAVPDTAEPVSIFRPEAEVDAPKIPLASLEASVGFGEGGDVLSNAAKAQLATIIQSPQMKRGGPITLRGHTDSVGHDEANLRASKNRADAVQAYLIDNGIAEDRITVIALGEMRPIAPNAKLDGSPDEAGRAANRRVGLTITVAGAPAPVPSPDGDQPTPEPTSSTLVEVITKSD